MELTYTKVGDYYIPDLVLDDQPNGPLGRYGMSSSNAHLSPDFAKLHSCSLLRSSICVPIGQALLLGNVHKSCNEVLNQAGKLLAQLR